MLSPLSLLALLILLLGMGAGHTVLHRHHALQRVASLLELRLNLLSTYLFPWGWIRARLDGERRGIPLSVGCLWSRIRQGEYTQESYHLVARFFPRVPLRFGIQASTRGLLGQVLQRETPLTSPLERTFDLKADDPAALQALLDPRSQKLLLTLAGMADRVRLTPEYLELELSSDGTFFRVQAALDRGADLLQHLRRPGSRQQLLTAQLLPERQDEPRVEAEPSSELFSAWLKLTPEGPERRATLKTFIERGALALAVQASLQLGETGPRLLRERLERAPEPLTPAMFLLLAQAPSPELQPLLRAHRAQAAEPSPELLLACLKLGEEGTSEAFLRQLPLLPRDRRLPLLEGLAQQPTSAEEPLLRKLLRNQSLSPEEKQALLRGLAKCGGPQTLVALRPFTDASEPALVRAAAREAMAQLRARADNLVGGLTLPPGHAQVGALSPVEPPPEQVGRLSVDDEPSS